jgi:hypothetical protein
MLLEKIKPWGVAPQPYPLFEKKRSKNFYVRLSPQRSWGVAIHPQKALAFWK